MVNATALVQQVGLLLPSISVVDACLLAIGGLSCIRAMPFVRYESTWCPYGEQRTSARMHY